MGVVIIASVIGFWCGFLLACFVVIRMAQDGEFLTGNSPRPIEGYQPIAPAGFKGSGQPPRGGSGAGRLPC